MATDNRLNPHESITLASNAQRLSHLKAIPGNGFCFLVSLSIGLCFGFLCNQQVLWVFISMTIFPVTIYLQKRKTGLWPLGFAPFIGQVNSFHSHKGFWKKMKMNLAVQFISSMVGLSLCLLTIDILEFRDKGFWWAPLASGAMMGLSMFVVFVNSNHYYRTKYSVDHNE